ncbi:MAG: methyltransferase [Frankiales bacterium]|nr:methyltransferase [Frankiales bacterium]
MTALPKRLIELAASIPNANTTGDPRTVAFDLLRAVASQNAYANLTLPGLMRQAQLDRRDAALATELGYGTLRLSGTLDEILRRTSSRELPDVEPAVLDLLRIGAYQLLRTRIPTHAAVSTTVDLARSSGHARAAGFVNAVLRRVAARSYDQWCDEIGAEASPFGRLALRHAHPGWIVAAFERALLAEQPPSDDEQVANGRNVDAQLELALAADNERPQTHLVGWPGRCDQSDLIAESGGVAGPYSPFAVRLVDGGDPGRLQSVRSHRAAVQDEGSQLCALALTRLDVASDGAERWLDLCAGPGGKAALLAALAERHNAGLTTNELHPHRAELVAEAVAGWPVELRQGDARAFVDEHEASSQAGFTRVLLDAPCTGLGALRRRPEARWRRSEDDLAELIELQQALLESAAALVRPGGLLGYVTCSPHPDETTRQVAQFLARHPDWSLVDARPAFPGVPELGESDTVQLWPHRHGTDAMFFAGLRRGPQRPRSDAMAT